MSGRGGAARSSSTAPDPAPAQQPIASRLGRSHLNHHRRRCLGGIGGACSPGRAPRQQGIGAGAVYRISAGRRIGSPLAAARRRAVHDLAFEAGGSVLVATGNEGKIYRLSGDPMQPTLVARALVQQVTTLLPDRGGRILFATSNPGKVLRLSAARADKGTYTSDVRDAQSVATWGAIKWQGQTPAGTRVEIATRSGNTRTPDETWADWSKPYTDSAGSPIVSPRARYLQWRAVLSATREESPLVTSVTAAYLPRNTRPRVTTITIHPPGTVFQRPFPTGDPEIAGFERGRHPIARGVAEPSGGALTNSPALGRRAYPERAADVRVARRGRELATSCSTTSCTGARAIPPGSR